MPAPLRSIVAAVITLALGLYPAAVYWFAGAQPSLLVVVLGIILAIRLFTLSWANRSQLGWAMVALILFCALALADTQLRLLKLYPVMLSLLGTLYCGYTLAVPPSAIERFALRAGIEPPAQARHYLRGVTQLWLGFFVCNGSIAAYTALFSSTATWAVYNGLISYLVVGVLLLGEWLFRQRYQRLNPLKP